ncbi:MAG: DUF975 family protein [Lachnospiraceae bacterium]
MWKRKELKENGKAALKRTYWKSVFVSAIFAFIIAGNGVYGATATNDAQDSINLDSYSIAAIMIGVGCCVIAVAGFMLLCALLINPFEVGASRFRLNALQDTGNVSDLGYGFDVSYKRNVKTMFCRDLYIILWCLLFIVPGIVKIYEYRMIPYLLADNPDMDRKDVFKISKQMMKGNKWKSFVLDLSFILWDILGMMTFGIVSVLYVDPYKQLTEAALYDTLKS